MRKPLLIRPVVFWGDYTNEFERQSIELRKVS